MYRRNGYRAFAVASALLLLAACVDGTRSTAPPADRSPLDGATSSAVVTHPGIWSATFAWPIVAVHLITLPNGRVLSWTSDDTDHSFKTPNVYVWDPANGSFTQVPNTNTDLFCSAHAYLPDARLMVSGGHIENDYGVKDANIFTPTSQTWGRAASMRAGRWYPTSIAMPNGEVLTLGGSDENAIQNPYPEVWSGSQWRLLGGAHKILPYYPMMHAAPDGRAFLSGPGTQTFFLNTSGTGAWSDGPSRTLGRASGTSVMYAPGKVLMIGGGDPPTNTAEVIDLNAGTGWRATAPMQHARRHLNAVILPDGRVLAVGGTSGPGFNDQSAAVLPAELWDPKTESWTTLASMSVPRVYHSSTVLLPDGRVLIAGGGRAGTSAVNHLDAQIFTPPYLLNADGSAAARPTISSAPTGASHGQTFSVGTPDPAGVARVTMVALSSTTHGFDMGQRFNELAFTRTTGALNVTMPSSPNVAPPGPYLLFVLNAAGVPSVGKHILVGNGGGGGGGGGTPTTAPAAPSALTATVASISQIDLTWTDNSGDETGFHVERCQGAGCTDFTQVATLAAGETSYRSSGLATSTSYSYRVRAYNGVGASAYAGPVSGTTNAWHVPVGGEIVNRASGTCMDVDAWSMDPGARIILWPCHGGANQSWTRPPEGTYGEFKVYGTLCLDDGGGQGLDGDPIITWTCHGEAPQQWTLTSAGELKLINGKCIELSQRNTANLTPLILMPCNGAMTQKWAVAGSTAPAPTNSPPTASFDPSCTGLTCTFTDRSTDSDGTVKAWSWNFGDGATSTAQSPSRTYAASGTYAVSLTVTDDKGGTGSTTRTVTVTAPTTPPPSNVAPTAGFTESCTDLTCRFTDTSGDSDGTVVAWSWNFGDGTTSTAQHPSRTYGAGGTYSVSLTVTDDKGATGSTTRSVTVTAPAPPPPPPSGITLSAVGRKVKGFQHVDLSWSGAAGTSVDIHRDGAKLVTTANDGRHTDALERKGGGTYRYKLCEAGTTTCSSEVTVVF